MRRAGSIIAGLLLVATFLDAPPANAAAQPQVTVRVDSDTVRVGDPFVIQVDVTGDRVHPPVLPEVDGLKIREAPSVTEFQDIYGEMSSSFAYYASATRAGVIQIPPVAVSVGHKTYKSQPVRLEAVEGGRQSLVKSGASPRQPSEAPSSPGTAQGSAPSWNDTVFVESQVDKTDAYEGEPILLTLSLWQIVRRGIEVGTNFGSRPDFPSTEGFYAVPENPQQAGTSIDERSGWRYQVTRWTQTLYPAAAGQLTVGAWTWDSVVRAWTVDGPQRRGFLPQAKPITITAKPLPPRPPGFSGAVGHFTLDAQLKRHEILQGVPTELVVSIAGQGNPDAMGEIRLPAIEGLYIGDAKKQVNQDPINHTVEKTFIFALTPLHPGDIVVPAIEYCYFDPATGQYATEKRGPFALLVMPSGEQQKRLVADEGLGLAGKNVQVLDEDILPLAANPRTLRVQRQGSLATPIAVLAPVLAYAGLAVAMGRRRRFAKDTAFARQYHARRKARSRLRSLPQAFESPEDLCRTLMGFIADEFNVPQAGLTSADVQRLFDSAGVEPDLAQNLLKILRTLERARYASASLSRDEISALTQGALAGVDRLDAALRKERAV